MPRLYHSHKPVSSRTISLVTLLLLIGGLAATEYVARLAEQRVAQVRTLEATATLAQMRAQLESEINSVLYLSRGLVSYVAVQPGYDPQRWAELAAEVAHESPLVRNIGLAPGNHMSFVYPLAGNEAALGLDYRLTPEQWPAVEQAIASGKLTLAGPLALKQGGQGIVARSPIFFSEDGERHYWGLASIVIDFPRLLDQAGVKSAVEHFDIAIRGRDGLGSEGEVFFGNADVFLSPIVEMTVFFPNGRWVMAARANTQASSPVLYVRLTGGLLTLLLTGLFLLLFRLYRFAHEQSLSDSLTGLANRRLLLSRAEYLAQLHERNDEGFALFFVDLNRFKQVNDQYGHHVGDLLLIEAANRLRQHVRQSDTLARNGGDEFILLQPGVAANDVGDIAAKLESLIDEPFTIEGHTLQISASVGCAVFPRDVDTVAGIINLADSRMYARKQEKKARQN